ncbi:MAG: alpha/beta fold hydrolase [Bacilli bacterium]|nr:alpha/beta fold hydrolase [Bacilli bacterium]
MFKKTAILFIHGFSATFSDNEYLINYLQKYSEYDVLTFTLPGHDKMIMTKVDYRKWIEYSEKEFNNLLDNYQKIYLIGHSMGGVIASYLASKYPSKVAKLILIAPGFELGNYSQVKDDFISLIKRNKRYQTSGFEGLLTKILRVPLPRIRQLKLLIDNYGQYIYKVKCPVLFIHGDIDNVVSYKKTIEVYNQIDNKKWLTIVRGERHKLFISDKKQQISHYINLYIKGGLGWYINRKNKL